MAVPKGAASATPIDPGLVQRITGAVQYLVTGKAPVWMSPQEPLVPVVQGAEVASVQGRQFDFQVGYNLQTQPRSNEPVTFHQMRALADGYDVMRLIIETRKDEMAKLPWVIKPRDEKKDQDTRCDAITKFFRVPDQEHTWDSWLRMLLEDLFVIDAPALYVRPTVGGKIYALEPIDGATIKRVIDEHGRTPIAPAPAYQQILKGVPAVDYTKDELIYLPRNPRTHKIYGYSPVEQVITTVNIAIRRQLFQLAYYTEGNIPEALASTPKEWNPDQVRQFQMYWDDLIEGDLSSRRHMKFVPDGVKLMEIKQPPLKDEYDEWLARVICFAFSIAPTPFIKQQNRATAETAQEAAISQGLAPIMLWVKTLIDYVIVNHFNAPDLEFDWSIEESLDPLEQATILDKKVRNGTLTINEARAADGLGPVECGDNPLIITATGAITLKDALEQSANAPAMQQQAAQMHADAVAQQSNNQNGNDDNSGNSGGKPGKSGTKPGKSGKKPAKTGTAPEDDSKKIEKKKSIDRNRSSIVKLRSELQTQVADFLKDQAPLIAAQVVKAKIDVVGKAEEDPALKIIGQLEFAWDDLPDVVQPTLEKIAKDGGIAGLTQIDFGTDESMVNQVNDDAVEWAADRAAEWVGMSVDENGDRVPNPDIKWQIDESTRSMLQSDVAKAINEGWSNDQLADAIENNYAFSEARAQTIARTETANADVQGNLLAYKQSGVVSGKRWLASDNCCDECQELDGEVVDLDEDFSAGVDAAPLHPNCECDIDPVLADEATDETDNEE